MNSEGCKTIHLQVFLKDHEGATLSHVVNEVRKFIASDTTEHATFRMAGGNAGVAAATNEAVEKAEVEMLASIFGAITLLCWLTFRSWRAVLCIIVPLALVSETRATPSEPNRRAKTPYVAPSWLCSWP